MPQTSSTRPLTPELRNIIVQTAENGIQHGEIANFVGVSLRTVQRVLANYKIHPDFNDAKRSGRPKKLDQRDLRHLKTTIRSDRRQSLAELTQNVNNFSSSPVSQRTVKRAVNNDIGMNKRVAAEKPFLTPRHQV